MKDGIKYICAHFLCSFLAENHGIKLRSAHAHEIVAAFFGYKSKISSSYDKTLSFENLYKAKFILLNFSISLIDQRIKNLKIIHDLPPTHILAEIICSAIKKDKDLLKKIWSNFHDLAVAIAQERLQQHIGHFQIHPNNQWIVNTKAKTTGSIILFTVSFDYHATNGKRRRYSKIDVIFYRVAGNIGYGVSKIMPTFYCGQFRDPYYNPSFDIKSGSLIMVKISIHDYQRQVDCTYSDERYSVRDNGAIMRHPRNSKRPRPNDNQWTFGKINKRNGYMHISNARVHRIVATAFYGNPPTSRHIVDHIDTNRCNNRPENLRWSTQLENALNNPITVKKIKFICGSIEAFLEDPSILRHAKLSPNIEWMRTVSAEEAQVCKERMHLWAKSDKPNSGYGSLGEWVLKPIYANQTSKTTTTDPHTTHPTTNQQEWHEKRPATTEISDLIMAKTPGAAQRDWKIPTEFPCCPQKLEDQPIMAYFLNLMEGVVFSHNHKSTHIVLEFILTDNDQSIYVICKSDDAKPWSLAKINFKDELYVHTGLGTFFEKKSADKKLCIARGLEWTGGDVFDDYC